MTATLDPNETATSINEAPVFVWFVKPSLGHEQLLLTVVTGPDGHTPAYRPLIARSSEQAAAQQEIAQDAANELGCTAVLREFEWVSVVDLIEPAR